MDRPTAEWNQRFIADSDFQIYKLFMSKYGDFHIYTLWCTKGM